MPAQGGGGALKASTCDVVVVGGGAIGLACAWRAAQRGLSVRVLERERLGAGSTWAAAGLLAPVTEAEFGEDVLLELNLASAARYPEFVRELEETTAIDVGYLGSGTLYVALDRDELEELQRLGDLHRRHGLEATWLSGRECRRLERGLATGCVGGIHAAAEAHVDPRRLVAALAEALTQAGAELITGAEVTEIVPHGAKTAAGALHEAEQVVLAAGCWSSRLADIRVRPVKGQILRLRAPAAAPPARLAVRTAWVYVIPRSDGEVVVGGTVEERGFDETVTAGAVHDLLREAYRVLPDVAELDFVEARAGLRPGSSDNRPLIGPLADGGPIVATGHYRNGILLAPITADAVVAQLTGEEPPVDLAPFSPGRAEPVEIR